MQTVISELPKSLPTLLLVLIACFAYRLNRAVRQDTWLKQLWEMQKVFWQDEEMKRVRSWIACDSAYEEVKDILARRRQIDAEKLERSTLTSEEYKLLEAIDRFAALLLGYQLIAPKLLQQHLKVYRRLFVDYWLTEATDERRPDLKWYFVRFYSEHVPNAGFSNQEITVGREKDSGKRLHHEEVTNAGG